MFATASEQFGRALRNILAEIGEIRTSNLGATPEGMPRRRRRLGHLSNDQKMLRRKLKNRVATQNARDKKKTESENLKLENEKLLRLVHKLQTENLQREVIFSLIFLFRT